MVRAGADGAVGGLFRRGARGGPKAHPLRPFIIVLPKRLKGNEISARKHLRRALGTPALDQVSRKYSGGTVARLRKRANSLRKARSRSPVGPLRCLATLMVALPLFSSEGW